MQRPPPLSYGRDHDGPPVRPESQEEATKFVMNWLMKPELQTRETIPDVYAKIDLLPAFAEITRTLTKNVTEKVQEILQGPSLHQPEEDAA